MNKTPPIEIEDNKDKSSFELSVDTQVLVKRLRDVKPGETIEYQEMSGVIGRDVQTKGRGNLDSARRILQRDEKIVFCSVRAIGVKRLENSDIAKLGAGALQHIGRTSRNASRKILCADYDKLANGDRTQMNAQLSILGALSQATKGKTLKAIEDKVSEVNDRLPLAKTIELFM